MFYIKYTLTNLKATLLGSEVAQYGIASMILSSVLPPEPLLLLPPSLAASSSSFRTLSLFFLEKNYIKKYKFSICKYTCFIFQAFVRLRVHYFTQPLKPQPKFIHPSTILGITHNMTKPLESFSFYGTNVQRCTCINTMQIKISCKKKNITINFQTYFKYIQVYIF